MNDRDREDMVLNVESLYEAWRNSYRGRKATGNEEGLMSWIRENREFIDSVCKPMLEAEGG